MTSRALNILAWVLQAAVALVFLAAGVAKFVGVPEMVDVFAKVGIGQWFRYVTGSIEVLGAIGLLWPRTTPYAGIALLVTMIGAGLTDAVILKHSPVPAIVLLLILSVILWIRRGSLALKVGGVEPRVTPS